MDTEYIKMCDYPGIQTLRREEKHQDTGKWRAGDFWTTVFEDKRVFVVADYNDAWADEPHYLHHPIECIWLPRQDQLQEMVRFEHDRYGGKSMRLSELILKFGSWAYPNADVPIVSGLVSMEQLWLAFYMFVKYKKVWDGKEWN